jgi:hypothetical protein
MIHRREKNAHPIKTVTATARANVKMKPPTGTSSEVAKYIAKMDQHHTGETKISFSEASSNKRLKELLLATCVIAGLVPAIQSFHKDRT